MSKVLQVATKFQGARTLVDRSVKLEFVTSKELDGADSAALFGLVHTECWLLISPSESALENVDLPSYRPDSGVSEKSPSERLRGVMWHYWKQNGGEEILGVFDNWYRRVMEQLIRQWKSKLESPF